MTEPEPIEDTRPPCCEGKPESYVCVCGCHTHRPQMEVIRDDA